MPILADNLAGYRDRVRRWLRELAPGNSFWSNTFIDQQINVAYRGRCAELVMAFEGYFTNIADRDLTANQTRYAWPPGFERLLKMEMVRSDGVRIPLEREERHYGATYINSGLSQDNYLPTYRPIGGGFVLEPPPGADISNGIRIEYYGLPTEMANDGDSMHADFPRSMDELVILDAVVACMDSENLLETGSVRTANARRMEWEVRFARYIDNKTVSTNKITPFMPLGPDA
jgi:hypothetical protein